MSAMAFTEKTPPPFNKSKDDYGKWKKKLSLWQTITEVDKKKQGGLITLRLDDDTQESVLESVSGEDLAKDTGAASVLAHLDTVFQKDVAVTEMEIYEEFESYKRPENLSIKEFLCEFEKRWKKTQSKGTALSTNVLAYRLLKSANLPSEKQELVRTTIKDTSYNSMKEQLTKVYNANSGTPETPASAMSHLDIKTEPNGECFQADTMYGAGGGYGKRNNYQKSNHQNNNQYDSYQYGYQQPYQQRSYLSLAPA